jgi:sulfate permease, SulP family
MVVVDATAISQTDTDGADIVIQIAQDLRSRGISLAFAHVERSILDLWTRAGAIQAIGPEHVYQTVRAAVQALAAPPAATAAAAATTSPP